MSPDPTTGAHPHAAGDRSGPRTGEAAARRLGSEWGPPVLLYAALTLLVFHGVVFQGQTLVNADWLSFIPPWGRSPDDAFPVRNREFYDCLGHYYPSHRFFNHALHAGHFPLWNPALFCGHPMYADGLKGWAYPPMLVLNALFPTLTAYGLFLMLHCFAMGLAFYWLARRWTLCRAAALFGGAVWMLCGQSATWLNYGHVQVFGTFLPFIVAWHAEGLERASWRRSLAAGALWGLCALHNAEWGTRAVVVPAMTSLIYLATGGAATRWTERLRRASLHGIGLTAAAFAVGAVHWLPFFELLGQSQRVAATGFGGHLQWSTPYPALLTTFAAPRLFGGPLDDVWLIEAWFSVNLSSFQGYIGLVPLLLAVFALPAQGRGPAPEGARSTHPAGRARRHGLAWAAFGILLVLLTPVYILLYETAFPALKSISLFRMLFFYGFGATALASEGLHRLLTSPIVRPRPERVTRWLAPLWAAAAAGALACGVAVWTGAARHGGPPSAGGIASLARWGRIDNPAIGIPLLAGAAGLGVLLLAARRPITPLTLFSFAGAASVAELLSFFLPYNRACDPRPLETPPRAMTYLQEHVGADRVAGRLILPYWHWTVQNPYMPYDLRSPEGHHHLFPSRLKTWVSASGLGTQNPREVTFRRPDSPFLDLSAARYAVIEERRADPLPETRFREVFRGEGVIIYENRLSVPRAYWVPELLGLASDHAILSELPRIAREPWKRALAQAGSIPPIETPTTTGPGDPAPVPPDSRAALQRTARVVVDEADEVRIRVEAPAGGGWLVLTDTWYPGWEATVNGREVPIVRANYLFRAVRVPAGTSEARFRYRPWTFRAGLGITLAAGLGSLGMTLQAALRRRRPTQNGNSLARPPAPD